MGTRIASGVVGALVAGLVFGAMMQMMGMMATIGGMVGVESAGVGWIVHLMISAFFGLVYGAAVMAVSTRVGANLGLGVAYGVIIWIVGPLLIMPLMMGGEVFSLNQSAMMSLVGHLVWGGITGVLAALAHPRLVSARTGSSRQPA